MDLDMKMRMSMIPVRRHRLIEFHVPARPKKFVPELRTCSNLTTTRKYEVPNEFTMTHVGVGYGYFRSKARRSDVPIFSYGVCVRADFLFCSTNVPTEREMKT